ncbi:MAG: helix-turn-helix domain-containing protein [Candidatus Limnocylindrales bacterium]
MRRSAKAARLSGEAARRNLEQLARLGGEVRRARLDRRLSQRAIAARAAVGQMTVSRLERGFGGGLTLDSWQRVALALGRPLRVELTRGAYDTPVDAGHLVVQELLLRLARETGRNRRFELPTRPADPARSVDVCIRDDRQRVLILAEAWNRLDDIGGAARSTARKVADAADLAAAIGADDGPYRVAAVWVLRATARNRGLVRRYPDVFATRFPGSSRHWVGALATGGVPPTEPGLVWSDLAGTRLSAWRRR